MGEKFFPREEENRLMKKIFIDGKAGTTGGNFYVAGTLNLQGGLVTGGKAISYGSGIYIDTNGSLTVGGTARVEENLGSNVYLPSGKVILCSSANAVHSLGTEAAFCRAISSASPSVLRKAAANRNRAFLRFANNFPLRTSGLGFP